MSDESLLERYTGTRPERTEATHHDTDDLLDCGAFGWLRGIRDRAPMLEVRHKDGRISGFAYAWLDSIDFDPSVGITISFSGRKVILTGRNLNQEMRPNVSLLGGLLRHRIPWIAEASGHTLLESPPTITVIEEIKVT